MTVGQSENIEVKVLAFIIATLFSILISPIIAIAVIADALLRLSLPVINAFNHFKLFLIEKYISFTNMPTDGKRNA